MFPIFGRKIRKYKIYITSIQIGQLAYGAFAIPWYYYEIENNSNKCIIIIFDLYIAVLLVLFCHFLSYLLFPKVDQKIKELKLLRNFF
jgi:hypothetical protein